MLKLDPAVVAIAPPFAPPFSEKTTLFAVKLPPFTKIAPPLSLLIPPVKIRSSMVNVPVTVKIRPVF